MNFYNMGLTTSTRQLHENLNKRRRPSAEAWDRMRDAIAREHRLVMAADPRSPRIRPTVATLVDGGAR
jgi:hypothetical protein